MFVTTMAVVRREVNEKPAYDRVAAYRLTGISIFQREQREAKKHGTEGPAR